MSLNLVEHCCGMKSVPPRGSGWAVVSVLATSEIAINVVKSRNCKRTHPLPRGGTDFMPHQGDCTPQLNPTIRYLF